MISHVNKLILKSTLNLSANFRLDLSKVNSVQEACAKCSAVHILKFEILQITWKKIKQRTSDS